MTQGGSGYNFNLRDVSGSGEHYSRFLSGWCSRCGRKRGADNRCADCDGWWTSPLLTTGLPVIVLGTAFLLTALPLLRHRSYSPAFAASPLLSSPASPKSVINPVIAPPAVMRPQPDFAPSVSQAVAVAAPVFPAAPVPGSSREQANLQTMTGYANSLVRAEEGRREAALWGMRHQAAVRLVTSASIVPPVPAYAVQPAPVSPPPPAPPVSSPESPPIILDSSAADRLL